MRTIQTSLLQISYPILMERPKISRKLGILQVNLGSQGGNELINNIDNTVQQKNSKAMEEKFFHLEESLQHIHPQLNTVQETNSRRNHFERPESYATKEERKVQKSKELSKGRKRNYHSWSPGGDQSIYASSLNRNSINRAKNNLNIICVLISWKEKSPNPCKSSRIWGIQWERRSWRTRLTCQWLTQLL